MVELLYLSEVLAKEPVGLKPIEERRCGNCVTAFIYSRGLVRAKLENDPKAASTVDVCKPLDSHVDATYQQTTSIRSKPSPNPSQREGNGNR